MKKPINLSFLEDMQIEDSSTERGRMDGKRKSPDGIPSTDLTLSASVRTNADVFPSILDLHVPEGSVIADVTYGQGIVWRNIQKNEYMLHATDIKNGVDCGHLPYQDATI